MKRTLFAGLTTAALLTASVPLASVAAEESAAAATGTELISRCIKQANAELAGTGKQIKRSQFDTIVLGSPGPDDFSGYPHISPGRDLFCGFGGNDYRDDTTAAKIGWGDVFVGGSGNDFVSLVDGGIVVGAKGGDRVDIMDRGLVVGGPGNDSMRILGNGRFLGRAGQDAVDHLYEGRFSGGTGNDIVTRQHAGTYLGGGGNDVALQVDHGGTFIGGAGQDAARILGGFFSGGPDSDMANDVLSGGRYVGGRARDTAGRVRGMGTFYGSKGWDVVGDLYGRFYGGPGTDRLEFCMSGDALAVSVERGDLPCPPPKS